MIGRVTLFDSSADLAKRWTLDQDGKPAKVTAAQMTRGTYRVAEFGTVQGLGALLEGVTTRQALCCSLPLDGSASGAIVTRGALGSKSGAKARTKQFFGLRPEPGLLFLDHDCASGSAALSRDALWQLLLSCVPALASAGAIWRPSGSSHIYRDDDDLTGVRGQHVFVMLADTSDGPRLVKLIAARMWLAGHGRVELSKAGSLLVRCPIDTAPSDAARLIFAAGAACDPPLEQRRGPAVILSAGRWLDSRALVPDLTDDEAARVEALIEQAKAAAMPQALQQRALHRGGEIARRLPALMRQGLSAGVAETRIGATVDAAYGGTLLGDFELNVVHDDGRHEAVTVAQVLADRERWHEADCLDPLHPGHRGGSPDCRLYLLGTSPIAYSLDDGGVVYRLRSAAKRLTMSRGTRAELVQQLVELVSELDPVFATDTGPVVIERGRQVALTVDSLMNLIGVNAVLTTKQKGGEAPADLPRETAQLVLAALKG